MTLALHFAARSHTGLLREGNEDSVYAGPRILAVADGMGGHAAGEVASAVTIAAVAPLDEDAPGGDLLEALRESALAANERLREMVAGEPSLEGMGTTLTAFLFAGARLGVLHIGDSRAYLLRDDTLTQITHDHTLVQKLVDEGRISEEEAGSHPQRSLITRALDGRGDIELDLSVREARAGDRYLLCTDGLTGPVGRTSTLQEALSLPGAQESCDRLVDLALRGGGPDNITVIVADVVESNGQPSQSPVIAGAAAGSVGSAPEGTGESSAARARTAEGRDTPPPPPPPEPAPASGRNYRRTVVVTTLVLALLAAGAGSAYAYVRSQFYVGVDAEQVAIFRGVTGSVGGLALSSVEVRSGLDMGRLDQLALTRVERGIVAEDLSDAIRIVSQLRESFPEDCVRDSSPTPAPTPTTAPGPSPTTSSSSPAPSSSPAASASPAPSASAPAGAGTACPPGTS